MLNKYATLSPATLGIFSSSAILSGASQNLKLRKKRSLSV